MKFAMIDNQKGLSAVTVIIFVAVVFAALNAYAYFNPDFSLSKYSPLNYFRIKQDDKRIADLKALEAAVIKYYDENNQMPARDGWCGRISGVLHPEFRKDIENYFPNAEPPQDPLRGGSPKDYFYYRVDRTTYILMAVLDIQREQGLDTSKYNFSGCHDWPGDNVYNYQISNIQD